MSHRLSILILKKASPEIRGKTKRYLYEIIPNVFAGTVSSGVRDRLWKSIEAAGAEAVMIVSDANEQGFSAKKTGNLPEVFFADWHGVMLPTKEEKPDLSLKDIYAKPGVTLMDHMLEAGTVAEALMRSGPAKTAVEEFSAKMKVGVDDMIRFAAFLCAAHDIGKLHPDFQLGMLRSCRDEDEAPALRLSYEKQVRLGIAGDGEHAVRHERKSRRILYDWMKGKGVDDEVCYAYTAISVYHHQGKHTEWVSAESETSKNPQWKELQAKALDELYAVWQFPTDISLGGKYYTAGLVYFLLGLMVVSDWIVSGGMWLSGREIYHDRAEHAAAFLKEHYLWHTGLKELLADRGWNAFFPGYKMNPLQSISHRVSSDYADLIIIEAQCGEGKTEAALLSAVSIGKDKGGIYFAAPTVATASGLADRLRALSKAGGLAINGKELVIPELDSSAIWSDSETDKLDRESVWCARSRHQMLYPCSVGTIDQVLKTVGKSRYACIGLVGISDKVVIVDEVHAYDTYMLRELERLIEYCRCVRVPVILLSATLPTKTKKKLFEAAGAKDITVSKQYPLVTVCRDRTCEQHTYASAGKCVPVKIMKTDDIGTAFLRYAAELEKGCLLLVERTVDDAIALYDRVKKECPDTETILFHARDTVKHKREIISRLLYLFGKKGKEDGNRPEKAIVVATSIVEQSLDIDMDYMVTAIAPIDLLIQRTGRVRRHDDKGTVREQGDADDREPVTILIPEKYGSLNRIYNPDVLELTEKALEGVSCINTKDDVRELIDYVYDNAEVADEYASILSAENILLDKPSYDTSTDLQNTEECYRQFDRISANTREMTYPTVQMAIVAPDEISDINFAKAKKIYWEKVVNVPEYRLDGFGDTCYEDGALKGIRLYVSNDGKRYTGNGHCMELGERGLVFDDAEDV